MVKLKRRSDIHWERKIWHMTGVALIAAIYAFVPMPYSLALFTLAWVAFVPADILRQSRPNLNRVLVKYFGIIMREHEEKKLAGTTYLLTGVVLISVVFPAEIVLLTLLFLAFADPIASVIGIKFGKDKIFGHKSVQGTLAAFTVCFLVSLIYLYVHDMFASRLLAVSLLGGVVGALAELVPIAGLDDNLTLPVLSAVGLWAIFEIFGYHVTLGFM